MRVVLALGIFWTLYGAAGILGFQVIDRKYRNHDWTKSYIRVQGISWLMIGIPWIVLYLLTYGRDIAPLVMCPIVLVCGIPSIILSVANERKYTRLLKENDETDSD